jgi:DNA invertase Pin-like site-specific DNA recombinase
VADAHVYADDGISGAEFRKRPGYLALMNALRPRPPFQALIVMEQSRLGRSLDEVPYALKRITDAGVRVYCYLTDSEVKRESAADKFMIHAIAFVDDMAREQSRERTHAPRVDPGADARQESRVQVRDAGNHGRERGPHRGTLRRCTSHECLGDESSRPRAGGRSGASGVPSTDAHGQLHTRCTRR